MRSAFSSKAARRYSRLMRGSRFAAPSSSTLPASYALWKSMITLSAAKAQKHCASSRRRSMSRRIRVRSVPPPGSRALIRSSQGLILSGNSNVCRERLGHALLIRFAHKYARPRLGIASRYASAIRVSHAPCAGMVLPGTISRCARYSAGRETRTLMTRVEGF